MEKVLLALYANSYRTRPKAFLSRSSEPYYMHRGIAQCFVGLMLFRIGEWLRSVGVLNTARAYCFCSKCGFSLSSLFFLSSVCHFIAFSLSLWGTTRYRLKYPVPSQKAVKPKPTNQQFHSQLGCKPSCEHI